MLTRCIHDLLIHQRMHPVGELLQHDYSTTYYYTRITDTARWILFVMFSIQVPFHAPSPIIPLLRKLIANFFS